MSLPALGATEVHMLRTTDNVIADNLSARTLIETIRSIILAPCDAVPVPSDSEFATMPNCSESISVLPMAYQSSGILNLNFLGWKHSRFPVSRNRYPTGF